MSFWDYVLDIALVALVLRQIRGKTLTVASLLWPVGLVLVAVFEYLEVIPTGETDLDLIVAGVIAGLLLGVLCAQRTLVLHRPDGSIFAKATTAAAILWVAGIGARLGFAVYAEHGGASAIARFSEAHAIDGNAWTASLLLMALAEVLGRTAVLAKRMVSARKAFVGLEQPADTQLDHDEWNAPTPVRISTRTARADRATATPALLINHSCHPLR